MSIDYVKTWTAKMNLDGGGTQQLLWGDRVRVTGGDSTTKKITARARTGTVDAAALGGQRLLEIYVIDVGQGDGVLIQTPDGKFHLVDAGVENTVQSHGKGAPNFIYWKFGRELGRTTAPNVTIENMILSHPDFDHFGGMINLFGGKVPAYGTYSERSFGIQVQNFYHCGLARFASGASLGNREEGTVQIPIPGQGVRSKASFIRELLSGKTSFRNPARPFDSGSRFDELAALVGKVPGKVARLSRDDGHLPGYGPGENAVTIHVLGPIPEKYQPTSAQPGQPPKTGLRWLSSKSETSNGHSIVLRLDYGQARILLTGDLNAPSQRLLLSYVPSAEFACDVAKACHHGSHKIDEDFLVAMKARATISSSGDNESYTHPRPRVLGLSAKTGRDGIDPDGKKVPPLLYSTELARSIKIDDVEAVEVDIFEDASGAPTTYLPDRDDVRLQISKKGKADRLLGRTHVSSDMQFGLVNVRTDGTHILFATMRESGDSFDYEVIQAGKP